MQRKYLRMLDLPTRELSERCVEMVLKYNVALWLLAEERFVEKDELLIKGSVFQPAGGGL